MPTVRNSTRYWRSYRKKRQKNKNPHHSKPIICVEPWWHYVDTI